jgi:hypothetical protein
LPAQANPKQQSSLVRIDIGMVRVCGHLVLRIALDRPSTLVRLLEIHQLTKDIHLPVIDNCTLPHIVTRRRSASERAHWPSAGCSLAAQPIRATRGQFGEGRTPVQPPAGRNAPPPAKSAHGPTRCKADAAYFSLRSATWTCGEVRFGTCNLIPAMGLPERCATYFVVESGAAGPNAPSSRLGPRGESSH